MRLLNTHRLQELKLPYAKPTRSLGGRARQQRAPRGGAHMEPKNIPRTWGHETDGDLNATRARERTKYGDREKLDASPMPVFSLNRQPVL